MFRARFLAGIRKVGLATPKKIPPKWRVDCRAMGKGLPALTYLARYLYRGVIDEKNILHDDGTSVTYRYKGHQSNRVTVHICVLSCLS